MVETQLPFHATTAGRLMLIARHGVISNYAHVHNLPSSWGTLAVLAHLSECQFLEELKVGSIHPELERSEAQALVRALLRPPSTEPPALKSDSKYRVVYSDPPWRYSV